MGTTVNYVLGHSVHEQERLMLQARVLRPYTERYLRAAGIVPGMRVLDLGTGMGDVALLAGDIVGPCGRVVGVDRDKAAVARAGQRAMEQGCSSWVKFEEASLDEFVTDETFDAVVGRYILLYQPDAAATLKRLLRLLKPGGIVVAHEMDFSVRILSSYPACETWDKAVNLMAEVFGKVGLPADFGRRLGKTFVDAGLPFPAIVADTPMAGEKGSHMYQWLAGTLMSLGPMMGKLGLSLPEGLTMDETLAERLEALVVGKGCQVCGPTQFGAWARSLRE